MSRGKSYTIAGQHFETQTALEVEVRRRLASQPLNAAFYDRLLAEVLNSLHEGVIASGQVATGWFELLDFETQLARGTPSAEIRGTGTVLVAEFYPSGKKCDITACPWRNNRHRYSDVCEFLTGKPGPRRDRGGIIDFEEG